MRSRAELPRRWQLSAGQLLLSIVQSNAMSLESRIKSMRRDMSSRDLMGDTASGPDESGTDTGSTLCTHCGLCCMGVLHDVAVLEPDEIPHAREVGLPVLATERPSFSLPCPRLDGTICSIYGDRPAVCSRYRCQLLQNVAGGTVPLAEALERVATAKALLKQAVNVLPTGLSYKQARKLANGGRLAEGADRVTSHEDAMKVQLSVTAVDLYIDKFFRNSKDRKSFELTNLAVGREEHE